MRITALEPQARNPERINVFVDDRFLLGVSAAVVLQLGLELEQELQPAQLEQLRSEATLQQTAVLARLAHLDLIDDRAFASFWVETREQFSPRGSHALKNELRLKGVERDVVDELVDEEKDEERALIAGRKKALSLLHLPSMDYATFRTRLGSFLQRRGFGYEVSTRTVRTLWKEMRSEPEE